MKLSLKEIMNLSQLDFCKKKNKDKEVFSSMSNVKSKRDLEQPRKLKGNSEKCRKRKKTKEYLMNSSTLVKLKS